MITPGGRLDSYMYNSSTAVHEECSMWVMPISVFVELAKLEPHQMLRASSKIVQFDKSMSTIFFLSHQCVVVLVCRAGLSELLQT